MDAPDPICCRCSKPITHGTASQVAGRPVHMRCLAQATQLESIELSEDVAAAWRRAQAASARAHDLIRAARVQQTDCAVCKTPLAGRGGVLFQGDQLVHAGCWAPPPELPSRSTPSA